MTEKVVIFGASQFAELVRFYLTNDSGHTVVAHTVDGDYMKESIIRDLPIVPFEEVEKAFPPPEHRMIVAMGAHKVNRVRAAKFASARNRGYQLISFVHSRALVSPDLCIGENTIIDEDTRVHPHVRIGDDSILISARIAHHCVIGDHCMIVAGTVGGGVNIGEYSFVGMNATIREQISIGKSCVIGAGALVLKCTNDEEVLRVRGTQPSKVSSRRLKIMW